MERIGIVAVHPARIGVGALGGELLMGGEGAVPDDGDGGIDRRGLRRRRRGGFRRRHRRGLRRRRGCGACRRRGGGGGRRGLSHDGHGVRLPLRGQQQPDADGAQQHQHQQEKENGFEFLHGTILRKMSNLPNHYREKNHRKQVLPTKKSTFFPETSISAQPGGVGRRR